MWSKEIEMAMYASGLGTEETRSVVLKLWALQEAHPEPLSELEITERVERLIPEKFGKGCLYLKSQPPYFDDFMETQVGHGFIKKMTPFSWQITNTGIQRIRDIEKKLLTQAE
jgi:hypothetical protein